MKMQNVQFRNIDDFLDFLPDEELKLVTILRDIVLDSIPMVTEHLSYNVPYYKVNSNICFIWPSSILWGKKKAYEGVRFGFTKGYLLTDEKGYLDKGNRKQVYWKDFKRVSDIDVEFLKLFIFEAVLLDQQSK